MYVNYFKSGASSIPIANIYNYLEVEKGWYDTWEKDGHFKGPKNVDTSTFCLLLPPPNVTGTLHIGHALTGSIQDALARWLALFLEDKVIFVDKIMFL